MPRMTGCRFPPGLSYFIPAIPQRPTCRGSTNDMFNHWIPTNFSEAARAFIAATAEDPTYAVESPRAVVASEPLVEVSIVSSDNGTVLPCVNWANTALEDFNVTLPPHDCGPQEQFLGPKRHSLYIIPTGFILGAQVTFSGVRPTSTGDAAPARAVQACSPRIRGRVDDQRGQDDLQLRAKRHRRRRHLA